MISMHKDLHYLISLLDHFSVLSPSLSVSLSLSISTFLYLSLCLSLSLSISLCLSLSLSVALSVCVRLSVSLCHSLSLSVSLSLCVSLCRSLSLCLSVPCTPVFCVWETYIVHGPYLSTFVVSASVSPTNIICVFTFFSHNYSVFTLSLIHYSLLNKDSRVQTTAAHFFVAF